MISAISLNCHQIFTKKCTISFTAAQCTVTSLTLTPVYTVFKILCSFDNRIQNFDGVYSVIFLFVMFMGESSPSIYQFFSKQVDSTYCINATLIIRADWPWSTIFTIQPSLYRDVKMRQKITRFLLKSPVLNSLHAG